MIIMMHMQSSSLEVSQQLFARSGEVMPGEGALCDHLAPRGSVAGGCKRRDTAMQRQSQSPQGSRLVAAVTPPPGESITASSPAWLGGLHSQHGHAYSPYKVSGLGPSP